MSVFFSCSQYSQSSESIYSAATSHINQHKLGNEQSSQLFTDKLSFVSCLCKNFPKGVSFIMHPKSHTSQRFLQLKL